MENGDESGGWKSGNQGGEFDKNRVPTILIKIYQVTTLHGDSSKTLIYISDTWVTCRIPVSDTRIRVSPYWTHL